MPVSGEYRDYVLEQLARVVPVTARAMFGGVGIYSDGTFFALIADDVVYLKTDAETRGDFEALGMGPFRPYGDDAPTMHYHELPGDILEDAGELRPWVEKALAVARRARTRRRS